MTFRSAVDWWYYVVVIGSGAVALAAVVPILGAGPGMPMILALGTLLVAVGLPLWLLLTTSYEVDSHSVQVRSGPFRWTIPIGEIQSVRESRSVMSSPALSLKRIEITYGRGRRILLSPADREGFMKAIGRTLNGP
jgi:hypothetical protein